MKRTATILTALLSSAGCGTSGADASLDVEWSDIVTNCERRDDGQWWAVFDVPAGSVWVAESLVSGGGDSTWWTQRAEGLGTVVEVWCHESGPMARLAYAWPPDALEWESQSMACPADDGISGTATFTIPDGAIYSVETAGPDGEWSSAFPTRDGSTLSASCTYGHEVAVTYAAEP
jgi:hypothetical protein